VAVAKRRIAESLESRGKREIRVMVTEVEYSVNDDGYII